MNQSASNGAVQSQSSVLFLSCPNGLSVEVANLEKHQLAYSLLHAQLYPIHCTTKGRIR